MTIAEALMTGPLALSLAACPTPEHRFCDDDNRVICLVLLGAAIKGIVLVATHEDDKHVPV